jgi:hypothetical protein
VPAALLISAVAPWAVMPLLMAGGLFLCYEGFEKIAHRFLHSRAEVIEHEDQLARALLDPAADMAAVERDRIRGAVRTDFILSAEIIVIALGTVATAPFGQRVAVLSGIALLMTVGVYGLVAAIVKLDDAGLYLRRREGAGLWTRFARAAGAVLLRSATWLMKSLSVIGTAAMFLVGGSILAHGLPWVGHVLHDWLAAVQAAWGSGSTAILSLLADATIGIIAGAAALGVVMLVRRTGRKVS